MKFIEWSDELNECTVVRSVGWLWWRRVYHARVRRAEGRVPWRFVDDESPGVPPYVGDVLNRKLNRASIAIYDERCAERERNSKRAARIARRSERQRHGLDPRYWRERVGPEAAGIPIAIVRRIGAPSEE